MAQRRKFTPQLKTQIVLEMLRGDPSQAELSSVYSMRSICETLGINKSTIYYQRQMDEYELELRDKIEQIAAKYPRYGYRRTSGWYNHK